MNGGQIAELVIFVFCFSLLLIYNSLYFTTWFQTLRFSWNGCYYVNLWSVGLEARALWAGAMMHDAKEGVTAAQIIRNMVLGVSVLAAATALIVAQLILLLTDSTRLQELKVYAANDPISGSDVLIPAQAKLGIAMGLLFLSLLSMSQCVRLSVHLTYILRAIPAKPQKNSARLEKIAFAINRRASLFFSLGLRFLYAFFPLFLYLMGPLALLVSTLVEVCLFRVLVGLRAMNSSPIDIVTLVGLTKSLPFVLICRSSPCS